ncbi:PAAR domain-containing protein [Paenibacillus sp. FSL K6-1230]|uniref:PAAR domain-containing protein n=1 Tax=Paenibacillus sp. FSL K6-1230 TaxID=2921603 RepID=UPI0030F9AE91
MPSIATVGSEIRKFTAYDFIQWVQKNRDGDEIDDDTANAEITGEVTNGSSKLFIEGRAAARLGDHTSENARALNRPEGSRWSIKNPTYGNGIITENVSTKVYVEGQPIAFIGSMVTSFADSEEIPLVTGSTKCFTVF